MKNNHLFFIILLLFPLIIFLMPIGISYVIKGNKIVSDIVFYLCIIIAPLLWIVSLFVFLRKNFNSETVWLLLMIPVAFFNMIFFLFMLIGNMISGR